MTDQTEDKDLPDVGKAFSMADFDMVLEAVQERQEKLKEKGEEEPVTLTLYLMLTKMGERFRKVQCIEQEFECLKSEIDWDGESEPTCPNGHSLHPGPGLTLGWVYVD